MNTLIYSKFEEGLRSEVRRSAFGGSTAPTGSLEEADCWLERSEFKLARLGKPGPMFGRLGFCKLEPTLLGMLEPIREIAEPRF